jgi:hypothetical protein
LAVEAHIRHEHTEYEALMEDRKMERVGARKVVWEEVKRMRDQWAGRKENVDEGREEEEEREVKEVEVIDLT